MPNSCGKGFIIGRIYKDTGIIFIGNQANNQNHTGQNFQMPARAVPSAGKPEYNYRNNRTNQRAEYNTIVVPKRMGNGEIGDNA